MSWIELLFAIFESGMLLFSACLITSYLVFAVLSSIEVSKYMNVRKFTDYNDLLGSNFAPSVSLVAPAYNEEPSIVDSLRSMMSLEYNNYEVIVVNDGSTDQTLRKVIEAFDLVKVPMCIVPKIDTRKILAIYKSRNKAFKKLTVINKVNGGKADALNAGINVSSRRLVTCMDVDCVLEPDAIQKMVKPFMEESDVIASGGVVRIANSCKIENGRLVQVNLSKNWLARFQIIEYFRAFLLSRLAWTKVNGLLLISGAFGMFDRKLLVEAGGYRTDTVGEDMELVVRLRSYMIKKKQKFKVSLIPDPLCWTEVPSTDAALNKQRNRWTRGTMEVLSMHSYLFFNYRYGVMGLFSFPFWFYFEWLAPLVEICGLAYSIYALLTGSIYWPIFLSLFALIYSFSVFFSIFALHTEDRSFHKYDSSEDKLKLIISCLLEPFLYHPRLVWAAVLGNIDYLKGKKSWGEMTRSGFKGNI
ncbi:MAG: glycosyltransferase [Bacteroidota bacterium]